MKIDGPDVGEPGDQYVIRIETLGKYRLVTWEKIVEASDETGLPGKGLEPLKYSVIGSFTGWRPQEMSRGVCENGVVFSCEVQLLSQHARSDFQIIVNDDMCRAVYPQRPFATAGPAMGPDELGAGCTWQLDAQIGETYKIALERKTLSGVMVSKVYWERIGIVEVAQPEPDRYYVVGSWDGWRTPIAMQPAGDCIYVLERRLKRDSSESFQILFEGYSGLIHPSVDGANPHIHHVIHGPRQYGSACSWTVGAHPADQKLQEQMYRIILTLTPRGNPKSVTWERLVE